jgi:hypothetical protein
MPHNNNKQFAQFVSILQKFYVNCAPTFLSDISYASLPQNTQRTHEYDETFAETLLVPRIKIAIL